MIHNNYCRLFQHSSDFEILNSEPFFQSNHWLNVLIIKNQKKYSLKKIIKKLQQNGFESRPIWKLNHLQIPYKKFQRYLITKASNIVKTHLCLPSGPDLKFISQKKIFKILKS